MVKESAWSKISKATQTRIMSSSVRMFEKPFEKQKRDWKSFSFKIIDNICYIGGADALYCSNPSGAAHVVLHLLC